MFTFAKARCGSCVRFVLTTVMFVWAINVNAADPVKEAADPLTVSANVVYYSQGSLSPNLTSSWNTVRGGGGSSPINFTMGDMFTVQGGHTMTGTGTWTVSGTGAKLIIETGGKFVTGSFNHLLTLDMQSGATYEVTHTIYVNVTFGTLDSNSNFQVNQAGSFLIARIYPNLIFNSSVDVNLGGSLITTGDLVIKGTGEVRGNNTATPRSHAIGRSIIINGGNFVGANQSADAAFDVGQSLQMISGTYSSGPSTGIVSFSMYGPTGVIDLASSGTIINSSHRINVNGTMSLGSDLTINGNTLTVNGTLNCGSFAVKGSGSLTTVAASTLGIGSTNGIDTGTTIGSIRLAGTRMFSPAANYIYNGSGNQVVGNGLPATIGNLTIANTGKLNNDQVTGSSVQTITALLRIQSGVYSGAGTYNDLQIDTGSAYIAKGPSTVAGDWKNRGSFTANGTAITLNGATGQTVRGNTTFYDLIKSAVASQTLNFEAGATQTVTHTLSLNGANSQTLLLRSTVNGSRWNLNASPAQTVSFVNVNDSDASGGTPVTAANSVDAGNNLNWSFPVTASISGNVTYTVVTRPVPGVALTATGSVPVAGMTGTDGSYTLSGFGSGAYTVTPSKTAQPCGTANGIFANDAAMIARHIVGLITLSPAQLAAAKVSGDITPQLSTLDAALIAQKVVGICSAANLSGQWRFSPAAAIHPDGVTGTLIDNYNGYMMGDVNGDWNPSPAVNPSIMPAAAHANRPAQ